MSANIYPWPAGWKANRFEMRIVPNTRTFIGPYTPTVQTVDLLGERWAATVTLPPDTDRDKTIGAAREAFWDRLAGPTNWLQLWHLKRPTPNGTLRDGMPASVINGSAAPVSVINGSAAPVTVIYGTPMNMAPIAQLAGTAPFQTVPGRTVYAGDHFGLPNGQLVRAMADAVADGAGVINIEFRPRVRTVIAAYAGALVWNRPTVNMMLKGDGVPTPWTPGAVEGASVELIEAL